ncbi:MAG: hypothetical protein HQK60_00500 [Deltaproteobacteria bacterium]|nr:hypothetical protein [Deltaproteobacteria bacterium]
MKTVTTFCCLMIIWLSWSLFPGCASDKPKADKKDGPPKGVLAVSNICISGFGTYQVDPPSGLYRPGIYKVNLFFVPNPVRDGNGQVKVGQVEKKRLVESTTVTIKEGETTEVSFYKCY